MKKKKLSEILPITGNLVDFRLWEKGSYQTATGDKSIGSVYLRLKDHLPLDGGKSYRVSGLVRIVILEYDANKAFLNKHTTVGSTQLPYTFNTLPDTAYITAFCLDPSDSGELNKVLNVNKFNFNIEEV